MPRFFYDCPDHGSELILDGFAAEAPEEIACHWCGRPARRVGLSIGVLVTPDVHEHFNLSIGRYVRSRRHLRDLQARSIESDHPFSDYEKVRPPSTDWKEKGMRGYGPDGGEWGADRPTLDD